jgi:hydroxymethylpyrimidine pyrophosphatase-like HAD family hydrolase
MRYAAIALDYDGTIARDGGVPSHVLEGLQRLKASGRKLLLATGRELEDLLGIFPGIVLFDRVVAENGALLYRPESGERKELGEPPPPALVEALRARGIPLAVGHTIVATVRPHEAAVLEAIANLGLEQQVIFNKGAVMILPPGCNKASGLRHALLELGLSPRNVAAAGDGENDHALLDMAEFSAATANAIQTLKDSADYVTRKSHGDGVLEVVEALLQSDLAQLAPPKARRRLRLGRDGAGNDIEIPVSGSSILVTGEPGEKPALAQALLDRLCKAGYQFCAVDTRGDYVDFKQAVVFGTLDNPPSVEEVLTGLDKPDVQVVVCLAAIPEEERIAFFGKLLAPLRRLREKTGRPHWFLVDEANDVLPASTRAEDSPWAAAENTIYVTGDPAALAPDILASVDGIAASGINAAATLDAFAAALSWGKPALPERAPSGSEALVWFRRSEQPAALIDLARGKLDAPPADAQRREIGDQVGQVLRRA